MELAYRTEKRGRYDDMVGPPPVESEYVLKFYIGGSTPARTERLGAATMGAAIDASRKRVGTSKSFARGVLYCDGSPIMEFTREAMRWASLPPAKAGGEG